MNNNADNAVKNYSNMYVYGDNFDLINKFVSFYMRNTYNIVLYIDTGIVYFKPINGTFLFLVY